MGQQNSQLGVIAVQGQQYRQVHSKQMNYLIDRIELYQKEEQQEWMAKIAMGLPTNSNFKQIGKYYQKRQKVSHINVVSIKNSQIVDQQGRTLSIDINRSQVQHNKTNVNTLCTLPLFESSCNRNIQTPTSRPSYTLSLLMQYHSHTLQRQVQHMVHESTIYIEEQLLSFVQTIAEAALTMVKGGFKQPLLSPVGIRISKEGEVKIGEWEVVHFYEEQNKEEESGFAEEGEAYIDPTYTDRHKESRIKTEYSALTHYYWPPEGTSAIQSTMSPGQLPTKCTHSQIFSLGMTILHMILQRPLYQKETYSQKTLKKYVKEAVESRKEKQMPLSDEFVEIVEKMVAWDVEDRIGYAELINKVVGLRQDDKSRRETTSEQEDSCRYLAQSSKSVVIHNDTGSIDQGSGDCAHPLSQTLNTFFPSTRLKTDTSVDYHKLDYTITRERKQWEFFENRLRQNSNKVLESLQMFRQNKLEGQAVGPMTADEEDQLNYEEMVCRVPTSLGEIQKIDQDDRIEALSQITNSIKLLDISNIKAARSTKSQKNRPVTHANPLESFSLNCRSIDSQDQFSLHAGKKVNGFMNESESLLLATSKSPPQPVKQSQTDLFTSPELMAYIKESVVRKDNNSSFRNTKLQISPSERLKAQSPSCVKEQFSQGWYEGGKVDGQRNGYGTFYYREGGKYCGDWLNGQMNGRGTLYYSDGRIAYQGQWRNDSLSGQGILYNEHPQHLSSSFNFRDFDLSQEYWVSYEGQFINDDKHGKGVLTLSNGERFEGFFKNDLVNGVGFFTNLEGEQIHGIWQKNQLVSLRRSN